MQRNQINEDSALISDSLKINCGSNYNSEMLVLMYIYLIIFLCDFYFLTGQQDNPEAIHRCPYPHFKFHFSKQ